MNVVSVCPSLLRGSEDQLGMLLSVEEHPFFDKLLQILVKASRKAIELSAIYPFSERACLEGTRLQSKYAIYAISAFGGASGQAFSSLYKVALAHGIVIGGGAPLMVPMKFLVVTEKTVFSMPEAKIGFHIDSDFPTYFLTLGAYGEIIRLNEARLNGKELVATGLVTHFVPSENLLNLEKRLLELNSGDVHLCQIVIRGVLFDVSPDDRSILHKQAIIDKCFSKEFVKEIIQSFGNWNYFAAACLGLLGKSYRNL
ncbi:hypothetical protein IFM89_024030 [Coptis chinensis]|uniref:3-hydroxyisobutyryl-CoA hydrolase n=1 Tax=Coptis chinensis TaxID=261450 RepID=A0A835H608_9MAGN|nr:hypothetical protein IFM89_024030 [Coptis chinensis]